jgi:tetratricopeptide (TPR) repeat protein
VALVAGVAAAFEGRRPLAPRTVRVGRRVVTGVAVGLALAGVAAALVAAGDPVDRVNREWHSFKQGTSSATPGTTALSKGFGGARYDFYRVSLDLVGEHPLLGLGADNFSQQYLARGRALEGPSYVHSVELRALVHTGVVGALLLAIAFGSALAAAWRGMRAGPRAGAAAAAGTIVFVHWFVQGSADFFWELPALGATAFAMLGVACAMSPQRVRGDGPARRNGALRLVWPLGAVVGLAAVASLALPWMATIEVSRASRVWPVAPDAALRQLHVASQLNPLSAQPALNEGTIAVRIGRPARAVRAFTEALRRDPRDHYATLMLGALASARGDRRAALRLLRRAAALNPQDSATTGALAAVRAHRKADPVAVIAQLRTTVRMLLR